MTTSSIGAWLVPATIWVALGLYALSERRTTRRPANAAGRDWERLWFSLGCIAYLGHVAAAFSVHHAWSHAAAYAYTADQTAALLGLMWGGGLWVNYAFSAVWLGEAAWWWIWPVSHAARTGVTQTRRGFFLFMIVNGAVVFVHGPIRWVGVAIVVWLVWAWRYDATVARSAPAAPRRA